MAETAAHLVDHVFPVAPVRQWVLSVPFALRYRMAYDANLLSGVLNIFVRTVFAELRRRAKELLGLKSAQCGAVTFIQRFGDGLNLAPHLHALVLDAVYAADDKGGPELHELPAPEDADVVRVATLTAKRVEALLIRKGLGPDSDPESADTLARERPGLAAIYAGSVRRRIASGPNCGNRVITLGDQVDGDSLDSLQSPRCATICGFSVHANVAIGPLDRSRLERLIRYAARPAVATERLSELSDGRLRYRLKRQWRNGTAEVVFDRADFIAKLAALIPAPRAHTRTYHGVLGPAAKWRPLIVPVPEAELNSCGHASAGPDAQEQDVGSQVALAEEKPRRKNYSWSELLKRVFEIDVLVCEHCGGAARVIATIHPPDATRKILDCLGLPSRAPPVAPARPVLNTHHEYYES